MRLLALLAAGLFAGAVLADDKKDEKKPKDEEGIIGTWKVEKYDTGGAESAFTKAQSKSQLTFAKGGKLQWAYPEEELKGEYQLDPDATSKLMKLSFGKGTVGAMYELDGDTLRIAFTFEGQAEWPKEVKADAKQKIGVITFKRVKDEEKSKDAEAIVGEWQVVKVDNGTAVNPPAEDLAKFSFTFSKDGKLAVTGADDENQGEYKLHPTTKPKTLDMILDGKTARVAYSLDGDTLTVAMRIGGGNKPPEELKADGKSIAVLTLKRVKKSKDAEAILGTWKTEKYDTGGLEDASAEVMSKARLTFSEGGKMLWVYPDLEQKAKYKMDPDATPKTLTMYIEDGTVGAMYELDGDTLRIALAVTGQTERPKAFKADGKTSMLMILKRVKEEKKEEKKDK